MARGPVSAVPMQVVVIGAGSNDSAALGLRRDLWTRRQAVQVEAMAEEVRIDYNTGKSGMTNPSI